MSDSLWPQGLQHTRLPCPPSPGTCSNSCPLSWGYHPTISSSVMPFSSCPQSFPASGSFLLLITAQPGFFFSFFYMIHPSGPFPFQFYYDFFRDAFSDPTVKLAAKSLQSCPTLCDPRDGSPPGSPVPGILQARTLEWVAISFSNAGKWKVKVKLLSRVRLLATPWTTAHQAPPFMGFSRQEYWSGVPLPSPTVKLGFPQM